MPNEIYKFLKENNLTTKSEADFEKEYSSREKADELHRFMVENKLTEKSSEDFYSTYFVKKKDSLEPVGGGDGVLGAAKKAAEARVASPSSPQQPKPVGTSVKSAATGLGSALPSPLKSESESGKEIPDFTKVGLNGEDAKTAKVLFENQDKDFVKRMFVSDASIKNADETISTHKMASANIDGKEIVFPTIVNVNGKLVDYSNDIDKAIDYAMANNEFIQFGSQEEASRFAEGGWKKLAQEYKNNPNTQPSIPTVASPIKPMSGEEADAVLKRMQLGMTPGGSIPKEGQKTAKEVIEESGGKVAPQYNTLAEKALKPQLTTEAGKRAALTDRYEQLKRDMEPELKRMEQIGSMEKQLEMTNSMITELSNQAELTPESIEKLSGLEQRRADLEEKIKFEKMTAEDRMKALTTSEAISYMQAGGDRILQGVSNMVKGPGVLMSSDNDVVEGLSWAIMPPVKLAWEIFKPEGATAKDNPMYQLGTLIDDWRKEHSHISPLVEDKFSFQLVKALSGDLPMYGLAGAYGGPVGVSAMGAFDNGVGEYEAARKKTFDANEMTLPEFIAAYSNEDGSNTDAVTKTYEALKGKNPEDVGSKMFLLAGAVGTLEGLPFVNWLSKFDKRTGGVVTKYFEKKGISAFVESFEKNPLNPFVSGIEEASQEALSEYLTNVSANKVYDASRELTAGLDDAAGVGFGMGFLLGMLKTGTANLETRLADAKSKEERVDIERSLALLSQYEQMLNSKGVVDEGPVAVAAKAKVDKIEDKLAKGGLTPIEVSALTEAKESAEKEYEAARASAFDKISAEGMVSQLEDKAAAVSDVDPDQAADFMKEAERLKAEIVSEAEPSVASPENVEEIVVGEATLPKGSPLADVEATAKALDNVARDEEGVYTKSFVDVEAKSWGKRAEVSREDLYDDKEQSGTIRQLAYDYHKAKADGSNPELVKAVEELLGEATLPVQENAPDVASPVNVAPPVVEETTVDNGGGIPPVVSPVETTEVLAASPETEQKSIINEQSVITNTTLTGLAQMENTIGGDNEIGILDTDPRNSEDFTYVNFEGEKTTDKKHYRTHGAKYRTFKGKNGKQYVQVAMTSSDAGGRDGGASVIFEMTGDMTPQMEQAIFDLKASDYKDGNVIKREGVAKLKNDVISILSGKKAASPEISTPPTEISTPVEEISTPPVTEVEPKVASPVNVSPAETAEVLAASPENAALKDVESTAKALESVELPSKFVAQDKGGILNRENYYRLAQEKFQESEGLTTEEIFDKNKQKEEFKTQKGRDAFQKKFEQFAENPINKKQIISEAYHKAKSDGSNPELVKAVEELLGEATVAEPVSTPPVEISTPVQEVSEPVTDAAPRVASPSRETKLQKRVREARERIQAKKTASEKKAELETIRAERAESRAKKEQVSKLRARTPKNVTEGVLRYFADGGKIGEEAFRKEVMDNDSEVKNRKGRIIANAKDISDNPNTDFNDLDSISMRIAEDMQVPAEIYDETVEQIRGELIDMSLSIQSRNDAEASLTESYERELMQAEMSEAEFAEYEAEQKFLKGEARLDDYYSEAELTAMAQEAEIARKKFESEDFGVKPTQRDAILEKRNEIKSRIKEKSRGRINAIPVDLLADYVELAMTYVQEGFLNTKEFINKFRADNADIISDEVTDDDLAILHNEAMVESGKARVASPIKTEVDEVADEDVPKLGEEREKRVAKRVIEGKSKDFEMLEELASDVEYTSENWADARAKATKLTAAYKKVYGNDWRKAMYDDIVNGKYTVRDNSAVETFLFDELISASEGAEKAFYVLKFSEKLQGYGRKVSAAYSVYLKSEEGLYQFQLSQAADPFKSRLARNKGKVQREVNEANKKIKKSKKEAIDSAAQTVSESLFGERVASPKQRRERGHAKVQSAKNKMRSIIMNSSSSFDVMNEWKKGGDFAKSLVEMAEGYVDIGIADAQTLVQKIKEELRELGISGDSFEQIRNEFLKEFNLEARVQERLRVEGADKLARKLANRVKERKTGRDIDPLQLLVDTLFRKAEETMPKRDKKGVRLTAEDKIRMAIEDYAAYKDVWDNSKSEFEKIVSELPISDDAKSDMLAKAKEYMENEIGIPYSDKLAEQAVKDEIKSKEMKLKEILLTANDIQAQTKEDFITQLTDRLVAKGSLTPESAKKIADKFEQKYSEIMDREAQSLLNKSFPQRFKTPKRKKTENQRIIEVVKYGVFDGKTVEQKDENGNTVKRDADSLFAEKFGFPDVFSKDIQDQIKTWVEKMVKLPEGSIQRRNVEQQFQNYMAFIQNDNNIFRTLLGMQYGNILFDPGTWINVIRGNMFRSFSELMTIATRKVVFEPNRLKDMKVLIGQLGSGVGIREAKGTIAYGQVRRGVEDARPVFAEIRAKYASNPVSRAYWKTQMLSGRIISMLDALFTEPITDIRYADLILDAINKRNKKLDKSERMSQSEIRELASFILGKREGIVTQAERMAVEEFEKTYGENFPMKGEIGNEFQKRVEELSREIGQKEGERMIGEAFEMYEADFQDLFEEARRVSGEIGMVGNPPGTVGLATALIKTLTGMTMPTEWFGRFMGAIAYSAKFTFDASPLGLITILKNAASKERGFGRSNKFVENLYKQNSVRTEYYGFNGNLEKREAFVRWVGFQMVSAGLVYAALGEYLMSALGGDDDERELVGKNMRDKFFGSNLDGNYWKSRPIFVTGRLFGTKGKNYTKTIEFSKATGVKPYTVYMWGKDMGTYLSDPTLMGTFGFAGVMNDAIMFNDKLDEGDIGVVAQASMDQFYIITQSSPFKNISEVINMAMSKREFSEIDKSKSEKMMMFAMKKLSDEVRNTFIPRIFLTAENNTEAILAQAEKNNVEWYEFITKDWPLINNFNGADQKFDHFGDPIQKETTLRSPIFIKLVDFKNGVPYSPFLTEVQGGQNAELYQLFYSKNSVAHRFSDKREAKVYTNGGEVVTYEMTPTEFAEFNKEVGKELKAWIMNGVSPGGLNVKNWLTTLPGNKVGENSESYVIDVTNKKQKSDKQETTFDKAVSKEKDAIQKRVFAKMFPQFRLKKIN